MSRAFFCALAFFAAAASAAEVSNSVSKEDASAIRKVISEQIDAFARDDGPRAFSLATAGIQAQFRTPDIFMEMVRSQYAVVYRPKSVQFQVPEKTTPGLRAPFALAMITASGKRVYTQPSAIAVK